MGLHPDPASSNVVGMNDVDPVFARDEFSSVWDQLDESLWDSLEQSE